MLAIATEIVGGEKRATLLLHSAPLGTFGNKTADALIQEGRAGAVIAYLESIASGYVG